MYFRWLTATGMASNFANSTATTINWRRFDWIGKERATHIYLWLLIKTHMLSFMPLVIIVLSKQHKWGKVFASHLKGIAIMIDETNKQTPHTTHNQQKNYYSHFNFSVQLSCFLHISGSHHTGRKTRLPYTSIYRV